MSAKRGFAAMNPEKQREIASAGGRAAQANGVAHRWTPEEASVAGRKGGEVVSADRQHMADMGRLGGAKVSRDPEHMSEIGGKGGFSVSDGPNGRAHMAEIGRRGGAARAAKMKKAVEQ